MEAFAAAAFTAGLLGGVHCAGLAMVGLALAAFARLPALRNPARAALACVTG